MEGGPLDGGAGPGELGQAGPGGHDVTVIENGLRQVVRGARHEGLGDAVGQPVAAGIILRQQAYGDGGIQQQAGAAGRGAQHVGQPFGRGIGRVADGAAYVEFDHGKEDGRPIKGAGEIDNLADIHDVLPESLIWRSGGRASPFPCRRGRRGVCN